MKTRNIKMDINNFANGGPVILQEIAPDHPYRDGKRVMEEIVGRKVTVVFPANGYDTLTVKVEDPTDALTPLLNKATPNSPVYVAFDGFAASFYSMRSDDGSWRSGISAKAKAVHAVTAVEDEIDFGEDH